jgi:ABC-type ATPase with predicted acetyltransferase domain
MKKEVCDECKEEVAFWRCNECTTALCDDCKDEHKCFIDAKHVFEDKIEELEETMFTEIEDK